MCRALNLVKGTGTQWEAQFLLCSPQYVLDAFRTFKEKGKPLSQTFLVLMEFFNEYTKPALEAEKQAEEKKQTEKEQAEEEQAEEEQAEKQAEDAEEEQNEETEEEQAEKPSTWTEFQKANKGKPRKQVAEEWQAIKKQRTE